MRELDWKVVLKEHAVFSALGKKEIDRILKVAQQRECQKDEVILREGERGDSIFLVGAGAVDVTLQWKDGHTIRLTTLRKGDFFGEMALFEHPPRRSATVIAADACQLLEIDGQAFLALASKHPEIESDVIAKLSARLKDVGERVIKGKLKSLDDKIEALSTKLDAELRAADATLRATQTVFDQTNRRANEIIESAERSRTRLTVAASAAGVGITAVIAILGFLGFSEVQNIREQGEKIAKIRVEIEKTKVAVQKKAELTTAKAEEIQKAASDLDSMRAKLSTYNEELEQFKAKRREFYSQTFVRRLSDELGKDDGPNIDSVLDDYTSILRSGDRHLADEAFQVIYASILEPKSRFASREILDSGISGNKREGIKEYTQTDQQRMLSYYLMLVALILDEESEKYEDTLERFKNYVAGYSGLPLKESLKEKFDPELYSIYLDAQAEARESDRKTVDIKKNLIKKVWEQIPG